MEADTEWVAGRVTVNTAHMFILTYREAFSLDSGLS